MKLKEKRKEENTMLLNDEICLLRDKLNKSIENEEDYSIIYKISVELDQLIANYYKKQCSEI